MRVYTDLHIHTALSPCSDKDMTPNNIVNMALIKGLDIIAITDHNSAENAGAVIDCARDKKLTVIPGMEVETSEEVHLICLFPTLEAALGMQNIVFDSLPELKNREEIFGSQIIMDSNDNITGFDQRLLLTATGLSIEEVFCHLECFGGVVFPAHVDRDSYSIISNLGMVPDNLCVKYLEVSRTCDIDNFKRHHNNLEQYRFIKSSDAHELGNMLEKEFSIELDEITIGNLINKLRFG